MVNLIRTGRFEGDPLCAIKEGKSVAYVSRAEPGSYSGDRELKKEIEMWIPSGDSFKEISFVVFKEDGEEYVGVSEFYNSFHDLAGKDDKPPVVTGMSSQQIVGFLGDIAYGALFEYNSFGQKMRRFFWGRDRKLADFTKRKAANHQLPDIFSRETEVFTFYRSSEYYGNIFPDGDGSSMADQVNRDMIDYAAVGII